MINNRCICCGDVIPEGIQVCPQCEYESTYHCLVCGQRIPKPKLSFGYRGDSKSMTRLWYNMRQLCCSEECLNELGEDIRRKMNGQD